MLLKDEDSATNFKAPRSRNDPNVTVFRRNVPPSPEATGLLPVENARANSDQQEMSLRERRVRQVQGTTSSQIIDNRGYDRSQYLSSLKTRTKELSDEHLAHGEEVKKLEMKVDEGEIVCGRMIQQYLEIARAIQIKQDHVKEDKEKLEKARQSKDNAMQEMNSLLAQITELGLE